MDNNFQLSAASVSDRGLSDKRPQNEDSYLELAEKGIFAVADGVGGAQAGDVASQMAVEILAEAFIHRAENSDAEEVMRAAIERANSSIYQMSHDLQQLSTMATTIVALHVSGNIATIGHVGDSRLYRVDSSGVLTQETDDHSVVAEEVRAGRMTAEQAATHPSRNVISRALGAESTVDIDMKTIMVEPNTSFVLCSDGITRHVDDVELESLLRSDSNLEEVCRRLKSICYDRGAEDNLTAVVVKVTGDGVVQQEEPPQLEIADVEEDTVATARSPFDGVAEPISLLPLVETTKAEHPGVSSYDPNEILGEPEPLVFAPLAAKSPEQLQIADAVETEPPVLIEPERVEPVEPTALPDETQELIEPKKVESVYRPVEQATPSRGGLFGGFFTSLLLLILGGALGAAGVYFLFQPKAQEQQQVQPPQIDTMKTQDIPRTAWEENLRNIDRDPQAYIRASGAKAAEATDFYFLGRAYLVAGNYFEAKRALLKAKELLPGADPADVKTLNAEIAMGLAIINSGPATVSFARDVSADASQPSANTNAVANTKTNAGANVNSAGNVNK